MAKFPLASESCFKLKRRMSGYSDSPRRLVHPALAQQQSWIAVPRRVIRVGSRICAKRPQVLKKVRCGEFCGSSPCPLGFQREGLFRATQLQRQLHEEDRRLSLTGEHPLIELDDIQPSLS